MKRRNAVKSILLFSLGTGIIFSCTDKYKAVRDLTLDHFKPTNSELDIIEQLSNMIVPLKTIPELENHTPLPFIFTMLDDIYAPQDRIAFMDGYQNFNEWVAATHQKTFTQMDEKERLDFVSSLNSRQDGIDKRMQNFFDIVKKESIKYLKTSEYYQRKVHYYEMAPGRFKGDVLLSELKNANQI
ncbi:MAG: gluconate 2-dehydrogenase subunit 3 family protein [Saprospiraceae bacterium]|nr:gluconate 2-dehydrogenase subunit 3 family protein [Saprospiraceae bacterium]